MFRFVGPRERGIRDDGGMVAETPPPEAPKREGRFIEVKRGVYRYVNTAGETREIKLPDIIFPFDLLGQKPLKPEQLMEAAEWFVYEIDPETGKPRIGPDGKPVKNELFRTLEEITEPVKFPIVDALKRLARYQPFTDLLAKMGVVFPYYLSDAMVEIATMAFGRRIKPEYQTAGSQLFYEIIGPVYDFFHQMCTQAIQMFEEGELPSFLRGALPIARILKKYYSPETVYYPNDAVGRDGVAADISKAVARLREKKEVRPEETIEILAVGDGPAMTTFKAMEQIARSGIKKVRFVILEYNEEQIKNGKRAYEGLDEETRKLFEENEIEVEWIQGDASKIRFEENTFDLAFSTYVLGAMGGDANPQIVRAHAEEVLRVLKPGGEYIALDFHYGGKDRKVRIPPELPPDQRRIQKMLKRATRLLWPLIDGPLASCYKLWDHRTNAPEILAETSQNLVGKECVNIKDRITPFAYFPLGVVGKYVLAFALPGYKERKVIVRKPQVESQV